MSKYSCRICLDESDERNTFIAPCKCNGSALFVHIECLNRWFQNYPSGPNYERCNTCHGVYLRKHSEDKKKLKDEATFETHEYVVYLSILFIIIAVLFYAYPTIGLFMYIFVYWLIIFALIMYEVNLLIIVGLFILYTVTMQYVDKKKKNLKTIPIFLLLLVYLATVYVMYTQLNDYLYKQLLGKARLKTKCRMYDYDSGKYVYGLI